MAASDALGGQFKFPVRVFHGTSASNANKIASGGFGRGSFVTPSIDYASDYRRGAMLEAEFNPKNPFIAEELSDEWPGPEHDSHVTLNDGQIVHIEVKDPQVLQNVRRMTPDEQSAEDYRQRKILEKRREPDRWGMRGMFDSRWDQ